jgi:metallo-beta-lactamase family protein
MKNSVSIQFLGAAGTVTGSKYLLRTPGMNILIDCGLFQGLKKLRLMNWDQLPVSAAEIGAILLTHGHLDHCGYLPRLVKAGYKGSIMGTTPTLEVAKIILEDSAKIQEEDAERANIKGYAKHKPARPLYTGKDVAETIEHFRPQPQDKWINITEGINARFRYNGHIIGATFIELQVGAKLFVFSGDIGRINDPLLYTPQSPENADVLLIESTYGGRLHPENGEEKLLHVIKEAHERGGTVIIPSFAVERTQLLMYIIWKLRSQGKLPDIPVYMDSPMAGHVLEVFRKTSGWHKLSPAECSEMCSNIKMITDISETHKVAASTHAKVVIAGSGMASGGRVLHYFSHYLGDKNATILLAGYQAEGTRGRQLLDGAPSIKMEGRYYPVKAKIELIDGLSAHADQHELIDWMSRIGKKPERIFIVHGEPGASDALRVKIDDVFGWDAYIPELYETIEISL